MVGVKKMGIENMTWGKDTIENLLEFDPSLPCKDCIVKMMCSTMCDAKELIWTRRKFKKWCKWIIEKIEEEK
jgi:hypothetical protein